MAFSCFAPPKKSKLSDAARACLRAVVERVGEIYRGPAKCLLINDAGELEFESDCGGEAGGAEGGSTTAMRVDATTLENLCVLKRASLQFAEGLSRSGSAPAMHLKSDGNVVSCFDAGDAHVLVVAAEMHAASVELLDTSAGPGGVEARLGETIAALAAALR